MIANMNNMAEWIYIKSNKVVDWIAVSNALDNTEQNFNVVRRSGITKLFSSSPKISLIGFPKENDNIITIDEVDAPTYDERIKIISSKLSIDTPTCFNLPKSTTIPDVVLKRISDNQGGALCLYPEEKKPIDLVFIDEAIIPIIDSGILIYSAGCIDIPPIRKTTDMRGLMDVLDISSLANRFKFIITNDRSLYMIAKKACIPSFILSITDDNGFMVNGRKICRPSEMTNMIKEQI